MRQEIIHLLNRIKRHVLNGNAAGAMVAFLVLTIFWLMFAMLYFLAANITEGVLIRTDKALSNNALTIANALFEQTKILASFTAVNLVLMGYQLYQRMCIKGILKREEIDVIN